MTIPAPVAACPRSDQMAQQPALSAIEPDLAVLGRQYRACALCRRPCAADDAVLRPVDRRVRHAAAVRVAASRARLAGAARATAADGGAVGDRFRRSTMCLSYWALQYTQALNALLIQSSGPLFVALWSLLLFGVRLTLAQLAGIVISLPGVLTILLRGDFGALASIRFNMGDVMFAGALLAFGLYSALMTRRPSHASAVADLLHHRLRRAAAAAVLDLGICHRLYPEARLADGRDPGLCRDLSRPRWPICSSIAASP